MANRYFEGDSHVQLYKKYRISAPENLICRIMEYLKEKYSGELNLALDVGCGSGQNTFILADYFNEVIGTDISPTQIEQAQKSNHKTNVSFLNSSAESFNLPDASIQLITAMAAVHWFDIPTFFEEGRRVLSPGGAMAIYGYSMSNYEWPRNRAKSVDVTRVYAETFHDSDLRDYWSEPIKTHIFNKYRTINIPYEDFIRMEDEFFHERQVSLSDVLGKFQTWSAFQVYRQKRGEEAAQAILNQLKDKIMDIIQDDLLSGESADLDNIFFKEITPFFVLLGRKPL